MTTVLTVVGILCLLAACHPFLTYPWSLVVLQALRPARPAGAARPADRLSCAVCVCAYNEERVIARKVENLLALRAQEPDLEILIYVDGADTCRSIAVPYSRKMSAVRSSAPST
jgi:cellulose synthase/poly-beta-1,6-N-acetylglucosamine synthase-like glycosyltransferase